MKKERQKAKERRIERQKLIVQFHKNIKEAVGRKARKSARKKLQKYLGKN